MTQDAAVIMVGFAQSIALFVIGMGLAQNVIYLIQLLLAAGALSSRPSIPESGVLWRRYAEASPPIALLAPAYNEALTIVQSVRSLLSLRYPSFEVIVINDGSKDTTLQVLIKAYELKPVQRHYDQALDHQPIRGVYAAAHQPRLIVVDKENGGKADALNAGINVSRAPIFCSMDADSLLEPDALLRAVRPFVEDPERTVAVGGTVRIANGCLIRDGQVGQDPHHTQQPLVLVLHGLTHQGVPRIEGSSVAAQAGVHFEVDPGGAFLFPGCSHNPVQLPTGASDVDAGGDGRAEVAFRRVQPGKQRGVDAGGPERQRL